MDDIIEWLKKLFTENVNETTEDIQSVLEVNRGPGAGKKKNLLSEVLEISATVLLKSGDTDLKHCILKKEPTNKSIQTLCNDEGMTACEIKMYKEILPKMCPLYLSNRVEKSWPLFYGSLGNNILLEDLKVSGYKLSPIPEKIDLNHLLLVMESLGRFHATSKSLIERKIIDPEDFPKLFTASNAPFANTFQQDALESLAEEIEANWSEEWQQYPGKLRILASDVGIKLKNLHHSTKGEIDILNHGDVWEYNILFKYNYDTNLPEHIMFIDYQLCHCNSPAWDLVYYMSSALLPADLLHYKEQMMNHYFQSLKNTLTSLNCSSCLPPLDHIKSDIDRLSLYGFIRSIVMYPLHLASNINQTDLTFDTSHDAPGSRLSVFKKHLYKPKIVRDVLEQVIQLYKDKNIF